MLRNQNTWLGLGKDGLGYKTLSHVIYEMHVWKDHLFHVHVLR